MIRASGSNPPTTRVTPAMAMGVTTHPWDLPELLDVILSAKPCGIPEKQPIAIPAPKGTARELPNGRGFLRVVQGGAGPAAPPPARPVAPAPAVAASPATTAPVEPNGQLDLLAWRPRKLPAGQLSLFGVDFEPGATER